MFCFSGYHQEKLSKILELAFLTLQMKYLKPRVAVCPPPGHKWVSASEPEPGLALRLSAPLSTP